MALSFPVAILYVFIIANVKQTGNEIKFKDHNLLKSRWLYNILYQMAHYSFLIYVLQIFFNVSLLFKPVKHRCIHKLRPSSLNF